MNEKPQNNKGEIIFQRELYKKSNRNHERSDRIAEKYRNKKAAQRIVGKSSQL
jgi:hypothetical protein